MTEKKSSSDNNSSNGKRFKLDEWESSWLRAMMNLVTSCADLERVRLATSPDSDPDSLIDRLIEGIDRSIVARLSPRMDELAQALATATFDLWDAVEFSRLEDKEDRNLALEIHRARIEKIADDFNLDEGKRSLLRRYAAKYFASQRKQHHQFSLNGGLLSVLDGAFELFVRDLMSLHLKQREIPLDLNELGLSYQEILDCSGPKEFRDLAVSRKVDSLIAKSMDKWVDWFSSRDKLLIDPKQLVDRARVEDFHLARNVLVHEGGTVSGRHANVANDKDLFQPGKKISPSSTFLQVAIVSYLSFATSIWTMATSRIFSSENLRIFHNVIQVELLRQNFYAVVVRCERLWDLGDEEDVNRINLWFAGSRLKNKKYSDEIQRWQPKTSQMRLAKMLMQRNKSERKEAIGLAQSLYDSGELSIADVYGWPILDGIRDEIELSTRDSDA